MAGLGNVGARSELAKSKREPLPGARRVGDADPDEQVTVTMLLKRRTDSPNPPADSSGTEGTTKAARLRRRQAFAETNGADPEAVQRVRAFAAEHGLSVEDADIGRRNVVVVGTVQQVSQAFGVSLGRYEHAAVTYRGREGTVSLPEEIAPDVEGVFGLDDRPQASPKFQFGESLSEALLDYAHLKDSSLVPDLTQGAVPLWPPQVAALYSFPTQLTGAGETIAIIELGGGYHPGELKQFFTRVQVVPPKVVDVPVGKGANTPGGKADGEVLLDIEICGSIAPGAEIVVYFAENSDQGFYDALSMAVHSQTHPASAVSISWGNPESSWTRQSLDAFDAVMADAVTLQVPVFVASGDHGAGDAAGDGKVHVDFPSSSPHAVACGGTRLIGNKGVIVDEEVWNDGAGWATGGGVSRYFHVPSFQQSLALPAALGGGAPGRGVPDIAGDADQATGYVCLIHGQYRVVGGTSAVAPLYAALVALVFQGNGRTVPNFVDRLYQLAKSTSGKHVFRDVTVGDNSVPASQFGPATPGYAAGPKWDACTGLGSINGDELLKAI